MLYMRYMGMERRLCNILLLILLSIASPAGAAEPAIPLDFRGIYAFGMPGISFGNMGIEVEQTSDHYAVSTDISLSGMMKLFVQHKSHTTVEASGQDFKYPNVDYETRYQTKKKKKYVHLIYRDGAISGEILEPPDPKRPKVPAELKNKAADPLSFILRLREQLAAALAQKRDQFSLYVFDGRRLTEADFTIQNNIRTIRYRGNKVPVVTVMAKRKLIAGYNASELKDQDTNEPPLYIFFSRDERLIPLRLEAKVWFGMLAAELIKECRTGESCLLGMK
jgi:hypothetical protein